METKICPVCNEEHSHNCGILLNRRLKEIKHTLSGYGMCEEHDNMIKDGFIFLIEIDPDKSTSKDGSVQLEDAYRTGVYCGVKIDTSKLYVSI